MNDEITEGTTDGPSAAENQYSDLPLGGGSGPGAAEKRDEPALRQIQPASVGRIVHWYPTAQVEDLGRTPTPRAAIITHVWSPTMVNLALLDHGLVGGNPPVEIVTSVEYGEFGPRSRWCWPPRV